MSRIRSARARVTNPKIGPLFAAQALPNRWQATRERGSTDADYRIMNILKQQRRKSNGSGAEMIYRGSFVSCSGAGEGARPARVRCCGLWGSQLLTVRCELSNGAVIIIGPRRAFVG